MRCKYLVLGLIASALIFESNASIVFADDGTQKCRMEQQCKWVNFKKICFWVKVCH